VSAYTTADINKLVYVNDAGDGISFVPSSILVGESPSAHGALSELSALSAHPQYMDISAQRNFLSAVSSAQDPFEAGHLTTMSWVQNELSPLQPSTTVSHNLSLYTSANTEMLYFSSTAGGFIGTTTEPFGRSLLGQSTAANVRSYLNLGEVALSGEIAFASLSDAQDYDQVGANDGDFLFLSGGSPRTIGYRNVSAIDHGQLNSTSLLDDDHPIYIKSDGTRAFTSTVSAATAPTDDNHLTNKDYVDTQVATRQETNNLLTDIANLKDFLGEGSILYYDGTDIVALASGVNGSTLVSNNGIPAWDPP
jgi:hypothetical protein